MFKLLHAVLLISWVGHVSAVCASPNVHTVWSVNVDQRIPNSPDALSMLTIVEHNHETLVVVSGQDAWVHVYDLESGKEVKRFGLGEASDSAALTLNNGHVVMGDVRGRLIVVDPVKGEIVWEKQLTASFTSAPVLIGDDFIVQTTDNAIYRFSSEGKKRWSFSGSNHGLSMYLGASPLVRKGKVYALLSNGDAVALKAYTGDLIWKKQLLLSSISSSLSDLKAPLAQPLFVSKIRLAGERSKNVLLLPFFQGELIALSAINGAQLFNLPLSLKSPPKIIKQRMYVADSAGFLHLYNIKRGKRIWSKKISSRPLMGPVLFDGALWLTDNAGKVLRVSMTGDVIATKAFQGSIARLPIITDKGLLIRTDRGLMTLVK